MTNQISAKEHIEAMLKDSLAMFTNHPTKKNLTEKYNSDKSQKAIMGESFLSWFKMRMMPTLV